jgi:hypothetical protein
MKKLFLLSIAFLFFSCNSLLLQKRKYMPGYYSSFSKKIIRNGNQETENQETENSPVAMNDKATLLVIASESANKSYESTSKVKPEIKTNSKTIKSTQVVLEKRVRLRSVGKLKKRTGFSSVGCKAKNQGNQKFPLMLLSLLSVVGFGSLMLFRKRAQKISWWALQNKRKARLSIIVLTVALGAGGYQVGKLMNHGGMMIADDVKTFFIISAIAGATCYPFKRSGAGFLSEKNYLRQKLSHLMIITSGFVLMVFLGNHEVLNKAEAGEITPISYQHVTLPVNGDSVLIINETVGEVIDSSEKTLLHLFPFIESKNFSEGKFIKEGDKIFLVAKMKDGAEKRYPYSNEEFIQTAKLIKLSMNEVHYEKAEKQIKRDAEIKLQKPEEGRNARKDFWRGVALFFAIVLLALCVAAIAILSCALTCSGYSLAAVAVMYGGGIIVAFLFIFLLRTIYRKSFLGIHYKNRYAS